MAATAPGAGSELSTEPRGTGSNEGRQRMARLIISNQLAEETAEGDAALPEEYLSILGLASHRLLWLARPGDVVVLPTAPDPDFVDYVWETLGFGNDRVRLVVPPAGRQGSNLLYADRLADSDFRARLRALHSDNPVTEVLAFYLDEDVTALARSLELADSITALPFLSAGGGELVNSKAFFRTVCLGNGVAVPPGAALANRSAAERYLWSLLSEGNSAIAKQDAHGGGYGNEILTTDPGLTGLGAASTVRITSRSQLADHLVRCWERYTYGGTRPVVIEHYLPGCVPIYLELAIGAEAVELVGYGEMRMKPVNNGLVVPPPSESLPAFGQFLAAGERIGRAYQAVGYRGRASLDAIVTPDAEILFNELNGRLGGSTHIHHLGEQVIGGNYLHDRVLVARNRCSWQSVGTALKLLDEAGLRYAGASRSGVLLSGDDGQLLFVAADLPAALALERAAVDALGLREA